MIEEMGSINAIRKGYADQLIYYRNNTGKKSKIAGVIITKRLINTLETRYQQLGGNIIRLYSGLELPSLNGKIKPR